MPAGDRRSLEESKDYGTAFDAGGRYREKDVYEPGISFEEVQRRYRKYFDRTPEKDFYYPTIIISILISGKRSGIRERLCSTG